MTPYELGEGYWEHDERLKELEEVVRNQEALLRVLQEQMVGLRNQFQEHCEGAAAGARIGHN